jgi:hypothetical protein
VQHLFDAGAAATTKENATMDDSRDAARMRGLLMASRNQLDWLWSIADTNSGMDRGRMESVLKLMGAIDYALGLETYSEDGQAARMSSSDQSNHPIRPLDIG